MTKPYQIIGTGDTTLVCIHYFGGDAGSWTWLAEKLSKQFTCILLNLPGFNDTPLEETPSIAYYSDFINTQIKALKLTSYILCGHSMGRKMALFAAATNSHQPPERIILIAPSPPTVEHMPEKEKKRMLHHPDRDEAIVTVSNGTVKKLKPKPLDYAINSQLRINTTAWNWWLNTGMNHDISKAIKALDIQTVVICSTNDPVISLDAIHNDVMPYLSQGSCVTLSNMGHLIPMEAPKLLAKEIKRIYK